MDDWARVRVFGARPESEVCVIRPSAYGLIENNDGHLAIVHTSLGGFLPGGGTEARETPEAAIVREALEECGLVIRAELRPDRWLAQAIQFVYSESEKTHFEKRSTFIQCFIKETRAAVTPTSLEVDHLLVWVSPQRATQVLSSESHCWAVEQWRSRAAHRLKGW